ATARIGVDVEDGDGTSADEEEEEEVMAGTALTADGDVIDTRGMFGDRNRRFLSMEPYTEAAAPVTSVPPPNSRYSYWLWEVKQRALQRFRAQNFRRFKRALDSKKYDKLCRDLLQLSPAKCTHEGDYLHQQYLRYIDRGSPDGRARREALRLKRMTYEFMVSVATPVYDKRESVKVT
ncbi:unnamed protein product, partial [Cyprideis torosa]